MATSALPATVTAGRSARVRSVVSWWQARPTLAAVVVYALLSVLMVGQGLLPGRTLSGSDFLLSSVPWQASKPASVPGLGTNFELADSAVVFQPFLQYTRRELPSIPLWNPYVGAGRPYVGDGQSAVFSLFSVPSYVLPFWKSLAVAAILKLFGAALGMYVLARVLGMRFGGALLSGLVFAFGTFFVIWLAWPLTSVWAFIPWTLALVDLLIRRPGPLIGAGLALVTALELLGGFPESSFHLLFVTALFFVFRLALRWRRERLPARALAGPTVAVVVSLAAGAGLAAVALVPFLQFLTLSGDFARRSHAAAGYWPRKYLGALFLHDYWGRPTQLDLAAFMQVRGWYAGAATLMLATFALVLRRTAERVGAVVLAVFCVCMVVGIPPVFGIVSGLPGFAAAHNERLLIYFLLSLALLAGWGLDDLSSLRPPARLQRRLVLGACAGLFCIPILWLVAAGTLNLHELGSGLKVAWGFSHPPIPAAGADVAGTTAAAIVRDSSLLIWLPLAAAGLALIALRLRPTRPLAVNAFVGLMVLLVAADLFRANMGFNPAISERTATPPITGAIRYLQSQRPNRFAGVSTQLLSQPLPTDLAMNYGLYDARSYDFPVETRLDNLWRTDVAPGVGDFTQPEEFAGDSPAAIRALGLLSVSDLLVGPLQAIKFPLHGPGLRDAYRGPDGVVYSNARALPRVFVVSHQHTVAGGSAALAAATARDFDGRGVAVTEHPLPGLGQATSAAPPAGSSARLTSYGAQRVVIDATTPVRGLLVLTDDFFPGWKATVDGRPAGVHRVDYLLRGVELGPGRHVVEFRYQPSSWTIGWTISLVSLLIVLTAALLGWRWLRRRRPPDVPAPTPA